jgi:cell division protein FtsI/penicillin-binding protein 2
LLTEESIKYFFVDKAFLKSQLAYNVKILFRKSQFKGFYENPQYVVTVLVEHGGHGGSEGGPIASKIFDKLYQMGYITIDTPTKGK